MTREKARKILQKLATNSLCVEDYSNDKIKISSRMGAQALRSVSREQVEKVWRGEWNYSHTTETDHFAVVKCSKCGHEAFAIALYVKDENFCPHCGAPMTDEAVQMVMERL